MTDTDGPYIVWLDYGCEGWRPSSFNSLKEALESDRYGQGFIITKPIKYQVTEIDNGD